MRKRRAPGHQWLAGYCATAKLAKLALGSGGIGDDVHHLSSEFKGGGHLGMLGALALCMSSTPPTAGGGSPLLESVKQALILRHYSPRTVEAYVAWVRRFVLFHRKRPPQSMSTQEVSAFLSDLATRGAVSASTQNQALATLLFLYAQI